jgi:peptidoglycan/xylan/chitin deacetylase (PgdA/CDA1 family)
VHSGFLNLGPAWRITLGVALAVLTIASTGATGFAYGAENLDRKAPYVDSVEPLGDSVPTNASIVITFTEPMKQDRVALSIQPAVGGDFSWPDDFTLRFQPIGLAHSVSYVMRVAGRSNAGAILRGQKTWTFTTAAGAPVAIAPGASALRLPILMYHYIRDMRDPRDRLGFALSVTPANFAAQMDWLAQNGYHTVTTLDLVDFLAGQRGLPAKPIVITFDDGYEDFYTAAIPVLRRHDFTAVAYVVSGFIGRPGYLSAAEILAAQGAGFEIGSHTVNHVDLTKQSAEALRYQLTASKEALEKLLGRPVTSFCYPYGRVGPREAAAVADAGYQDATSTRGGSYRTMAGRFAWTRLRVNGGEPLWQFAAYVRADS